MCESWTGCGRRLPSLVRWRPTTLPRAEGEPIPRTGGELGIFFSSEETHSRFLQAPLLGHLRSPAPGQGREHLPLLLLLGRGAPLLGHLLCVRPRHTPPPPRLLPPLLPPSREHHKTGFGAKQATASVSGRYPSPARGPSCLACAEHLRPQCNSKTGSQSRLYRCLGKSVCHLVVPRHMSCHQQCQGHPYLPCRPSSSSMAWMSPLRRPHSKLRRGPRAPPSRCLTRQIQPERPRTQRHPRLRCDCCSGPACAARR